MNGRSLILGVAIIASIIAAAAAVEVAYAFMSETENGGNNFDGDPVEIRVLDLPNGNNIKMQLPLVNKSAIEGNGPWHFTSYNRSVSGYLDTVCPNNSGYIRVWIDMKNPESWAVVQTVTLNIFEDDIRSVEYVLFRADSELMEVGGEPVRKTIPVQTWTGDEARKIVVSVEYKDRITVNPWKIGEDASELLVSTVSFLSATKDPVPSIPVVFHVGDDKILDNGTEVYPGNVINPPFMPEGYESTDWTYEVSTGVFEEWDFETHHFSMADLNGKDKLHLYSKKVLKQYPIHYNLDGGSDSNQNPNLYTVENDFFFPPSESEQSYPEGFKLKDPVATGYVFVGWSGTGITGTSKDVTIKDMHNERYYDANWSYTVKFSANYGSGGSGTGTMEDMTISKSSYRSLTPNAFVNNNTDKVFLYWSTKADDSSGSHHYADRASIIDLPTDTGLDTSTVILYAIWVNKCTLTYNAGDCGGTPPSLVDRIVPGTLVEVTDKGELTGEFVGWSTSITSPYEGVFYYPGDEILISSNTTLYAVDRDYTVTFDANGGYGSMAPQMMSFNVSIPLKTCQFYKEDHLLLHWNTQADDGGTSYYDEQSIRLAGNVTLYAIWGIGVTYNPDGADSGTVPKPTVIKMSGALTLATNTGSLAKAGCTFGGWNTQADGLGTTYEAGATIGSFTTTQTLYALWKCDVTYKNGSSTVGEVVHTVYDAEITVREAPTQEGYTFVNWNTKSNGEGDAHTPGNKMLVEGDTTLYATWRAKVTIQFNSNGGTGEMEALTVDSGVRTQLTLNTYEKTDYAFYCWNTDANGNGTSYSNGAFVTLSSDTPSTVILYAIWKHAVTFNKNGGPTDVIMPGTYYANNGGTVPVPYIVMDGYSVEWYTDSACTPENRFYLVGESGTPSTVSTNTPLYAKWFVTVYFVNNDKNRTVDNELIQDRKQSIPDNIPTAIEASKVYSESQKGWNTRSDGSGIFYANTASLQLKNPLALFGWYKDSISFNANGGVGYMAPQDMTPGSPVTLNKNLFTWTGHEFMGWNTKADGTGDNYSDQGAITVYNITTLYAKWKGKVTVTLDQTDATSTIDSPITWFIGETVNNLESVPARTGYEFGGFYTGIEGGGFQIYNASGVVQNQTGYIQEGKAVYSSKATLTLYAKWTVIANYYSVEFDENGGTGETMANQSFGYDESKALSANAYTAPSGMTFVGWAESASGPKVYSNMQVVSHLTATQGATVTLYAVWGYALSFNANGGTGDVPATAPYKSGTIVIMPEQGSLERTGYTFVGWNTQADGEGTTYAVGTEFTMPGSNQILYAKWTYIANYYSVSFNPVSTSGEGTGTMENQPFGYGESKALSENGFTVPSGMTFVGWATSASGNKVYDDEQVVTNLSTVKGTTVTLYAVWGYVLSFNANEGTGDVPASKLDVAGAQITLPGQGSLERTGYIFVGWNTQADGLGTTYEAGDEYTMPIENQTLFAKWEAA